MSLDETERCPVKHPAFEAGQCVLDAGHGGPHNLEGARGQAWRGVLGDFSKLPPHEKAKYELATWIAGKAPVFWYGIECAQLLDRLDALLALRAAPPEPVGERAREAFLAIIERETDLTVRQAERLADALVRAADTRGGEPRTEPTLDDLLALHNVGTVGELNAYIGALEERDQQRGGGDVSEV